MSVAAAGGWMLLTGIASAGELPLLLVPATPPPGFSNGSIGYATGVRSSAEALPETGWASDDPHVLCEVFLGRVLTATWTVEGRAESWPTALPATAECRNGIQRVPFALAFRLGARDSFVATTGTLVVPHDGEAPLSVRWPVASPAVSAIALGPDRGVACGVNGGGEWTLQLGPSSLAGPLVCQLTLASGAVVENEVLVVRTRR